MRAVYYSDEISEMIKSCEEYSREPFRHTWEFKNPETIYQVVLKRCQNLYHNDSKTDTLNFKMAINDFFPEGVYPKVKQLIIDTWEKE